jgi:hypothetical protein
MSNRNEKLVFIGKVLVAAISFSALVAVAARQLVPAIPLSDVLLYSAASVVGIMVLVIIAAICSLYFSQFILRAGGTDAQWFWFSSEPRGLVALREQHAAKKQAGETS